MNSTLFKIPLDLTTSSFLQACKMLGAMPVEVTLYCPYRLLDDAAKIAKEYGVRVVFLPDELAVTRRSWAAGLGRDYVVSVVPL